MDTVAPTTRAGELTVRQLNLYIDAEFERLVALGFAAGEDFAATVPTDATSVRWSVMVLDRGTKWRMPSDYVTGRANDGSPICRAPLLST